MLRKITVYLICVVSLAGILNFRSYSAAYVNSKSVRSYIKNGITMVSVRDFFNAAGEYEILWNTDTKTAEIKGDKFTMYVYSDKAYSLANGRGLCRYITNENRESTLYFPLTVGARALGLEVSWNAKTKSASASGKIKVIEKAENYYNSKDLQYLARIIEAESGAEPFFGKIAVGNVVLNRVKNIEFPNTIKDVIYDEKYGVQFTPVANGSINNTPGKESIIAAKCTLDGFCISGDILYFLNPKIAKSLWIVDNRKFAFTIGTHDFYL